jgi:hypothetical protein
MPSSAQTVTVAYPGGQIAGNCNVVVVGWDGAAQVASVTDLLGNSYTLAVGPTSVTGNSTQKQSIYCAPNIKAGTNSVIVTFSATASYPDIRILEYSGVAATNPVDVVTAFASNNTANSTLPSFTNTVLTKYAPDLLVAANTVEGLTTGTGGARFTQRILTSPDGNIVEDAIATVPGYYSAASGKINGSSSWVMQMIALRGASAQPSDTTPPTVSVVAPTSGTGTITGTVNASDNSGGTGVNSVLFLVDSVPYGTAAIAPPYTFPLDTSKFANGGHTLTAIAYDAAGNSATSDPVSLTFSNTGAANPAVVGVMSGLVTLPIVSTNATLLSTGEVYMNDGESLGYTCLTWDPIGNTFNWIPALSSTLNEFCSAVEQLGNGQMIIVGGQAGAKNDNGIVNVNELDPNTLTWTALPSMTYPRWYPGATVLQDGSVLVVSGEINGVGADALICERYFPSTNSWTQLNKQSASFPYHYYYPHDFLLADGRVFTAATTEHAIVSQVLDVNAQTWTPVDSTHTYDGGSSVMYAPGKIIKMGHWGFPNSVTNAVATAYTIDMTAATPLWQQVGSMAYPRSFHNATALPDGTVLVTGGGKTTAAADYSNAVLPVEVWSPTTLNWTTLASINTGREYHSEGLLLPDARVLISGGGRFNNDNETTYNYSCEFFAPPYLFKGARPTITAAPAQIPYGGTFTVTTPDATSIASVSLVRYGAVTHGMNFSQRFLPLSFTLSGSNSLIVTAPTNAYLAPPGNYLLFILNAQGVPSLAATVHF